MTPLFYAFFQQQFHIIIAPIMLSLMHESFLNNHLAHPGAYLLDTCTLLHFHHHPRL